MSRAICVLVRIDHDGHTVTLTVTGELTPAAQQELTLMTGRARALFPDTTVTADLDSAHLVDTDECRRPEWAVTNHRGDGQPEISTTPAPPFR